MSQPKDRDLLRQLELISRIKPSPEATERAMNKTRQALLSQSQTADQASSTSRPRIIRLFSQPAFKAAAAAVVVLTLSLSAALWHRYGRTEPPRMVSHPTAMASKEDPKQPTTAAVSAQQIASLAAQGDVPGLVAFMEHATPEHRILAAQHLSRMGDSRAIATLERFARQMSELGDQNPYQQALDAINRRGETSRTDTMAADVGPTSPESRPQDAHGLATRQEMKGLLCGMVTDRVTGQALSDVEIEVFGASRYFTLTDANGLYCFEHIEQDGRYQIKISRPGYLVDESLADLPIVTLSQHEPIVRNFVLERGCLLEVEVTDVSGEPIEDVRLMASWLGSDQSRTAGLPTSTDQEGLAVLGTLAASNIAYRVTALHTDFAPQQATVLCNDVNSVKAVNMVMQEGQDIPGFATYADGVPAAGVEIYVKPEWWHGNQPVQPYRVGPDGDFSLAHVTPGTYTVYAIAAENEPSDSVTEVTRVELPLKDGDLLTLKLPERSPASLAALQGSIQWDGDARPDYVELCVYGHGPWGLQFQTLTGEDLEAFQITGLEPGTYTLYFHGSNVEEKTVLDVNVPGQPLTVPLVHAEPPLIQGYVVQSRSGEVIENYTVSLKKNLYLPGMAVSVSRTLRRFVDMDDEFSIPSSGPGTYVLGVSAEGFVPTTIEQYFDAQSDPLLIKLRRGGRILGRVVNADGHPVSDAKVTLLPGAYHRANALGGKDRDRSRTQDGTFVLSNVPPGHHKVRIHHPEFGSIVIGVREVAAEVTTSLGQVALYPGGTIEGHVLSPDGLPVSDAFIIVDDGQVDQDVVGQLGTAVTNEEGFYRIQGLPPDLCYVYRRNPDRNTGVVRRSVIPRDGEMTRVDFGVGPAVMGILQLEGLPVADQRILLADPEMPDSKAFQCFAQTDGNGAFIFNGIPVGRYGIYHRLNSANRWIKVETVDVGHLPITLGVVPKQLHELQVSLITDGQANVGDWTVYAQEGAPIQSQMLGEVLPPSAAGDPFTIQRVPAGRIQVVARRADGLRTVRRAYDVTADRSIHTLDLRLPSGTASVQGKLMSSHEQPLVLFDRDQTLLCGIVGEDGYYQVDALPAGDYYIGNAYLGDRAPLVELTLAAGETLERDLDTSEWIAAGQGLLSVFVAGQDGLPLPAANAWLEGGGGQIGPLLRTDSEITFIAPVGLYTLNVSHPEFLAGQADVTLAASDIIALNPERTVVQIRLDSIYPPF